jgi:manganese efflux pump family protein
MAIAALVAWILTAGGGFYMLAKWIAGGGHRRPGTTKLPPPVVFGHFLLAAVGLVLWIIYVVADNDPMGWVALVALVPVAALGFTMLRFWIPSYRTSRAPAGAGTSAASPSSDAPPERSFPVVVVGAHGVLAVVTVVLVLLTMLHIGGS